MAIPTAPRRLILRACVGLAGLLAGPVVSAQATPPLNSQRSPGAVPGSGGIAVSAYPIVTGEPFTAENNSRRVEIKNGKRIVSESHSIVARDSAGRVATRTPESRRVPPPDGGGGTFVPGGGNVTDPIAMTQTYWNDGGPPPLNDVVFKNRILPNTPVSGRLPLNACERRSSHTRNYRNRKTQQIADLGKRTIQRILTRGRRVTTVTPAWSIHNDRPLAITDDCWR